MKNILAKLEFHYTYLILALSFVLTGYFSNLLVFTSIIIIHEIGHVLMGKICKYKIKKIIIYPYGGLVKFDKLINTKIEKDLLVSISGLLMQSIYFILIYFLHKNGIVRDYIYNLFYIYNKSIFIFNLLPILPLDGSKIFNLIISKFISFDKANKISVFTSLIILILLIIRGYYENNYSFLLVIFILLYNIYNFYMNIGNLYNRFLLERYLYNINYKKN